MTRASAARAESCLDDTGRRMAADAVRIPAIGWFAAARSRAFAAASLAAAAAVVAAILLTFQHLRNEREFALREAGREVGMRATIVAARLDAALRSAPRLSPPDVFRRVMDADPGERLAKAVLFDRNGRALAADPPEAAADSDLDHALLVQNERSEAARVADERGGEHFAVARALPALEGRVVFAAPVAPHLAAWRRVAAVTVVLLASTVALILAATGLYAADARARLGGAGALHRAPA